MQLILRFVVICMPLIMQISCYEPKYITSGSHEVLKSGFLTLAGTNFYIGEEPKSWSSANDACANMKMALISLQDEEKEKQVNDLVIARGLGDTYIWSSGTHMLGEWTWSSVGEPLSHTRWYPGEPNDQSPEACLQFQANYGWFDYNCLAEFPFMCEELKIWP